MLLLDAATLTDRRRIAADALKPLADSLARDLEPLLTREPYVPTGKALLSRIGGRCETDGTDLEFDPQSPHAHRCPACGRIHGGEWHDRWWLYPYHLWLAERAVHAATLHAVAGDARMGQLARAIVAAYARQYLGYPNRDNVLGPSRLFFSTYLESLWLLHICIAADLLGATGDADLVDGVRADIAAPAVALIETYHEGASNRQVWNNAAVVAARRLLGEAADAPGIVSALADTELLLNSAVGEDGSWYEGDNYHQFAHRGLWYCIALGARLGYAFQDESLARFDAGFAAPFRTMLPDFTFPARKDSRYAASLRQWRFAESCELGLARSDDPVLRWALARMYADDIPRGETGRARSSGEAERNLPPVSLSRTDLGWKSLLFARERPDLAAGEAPGSVTVWSQGYSIHRRERGDVYVALDWGASGGGHGHPDGLNLVFAHGSTRWLDDLGTGSYVDPSLHWYRSTLAHNAPLVNGASQVRTEGRLVAHSSGGGFDVVSACAPIARGVVVTRTVLTGSTYFVDEVRWTSESPVRFELPVHFDADAKGLSFAPAPLVGAGGVEDGYDFTRNARRAGLPARTAARLVSERGGHEASACAWTSHDAEWFVAEGPGQPASAMRRFHVLRMHGTSGTIRAVWSWTNDVTATFDGEGIVVDAGGHEDRHTIGVHDWIVARDGATIADFVLEAAPGAGAGTAPGPRDAEGAEPAHIAPPLVPLAEPAWYDVRRQTGVVPWYADAPAGTQGAWAVFLLGEDHYRRTEESWRDAGEPAARVAVGADDQGIVVDVAVEAPSPVFVAGNAVNAYDNEEADVNGHGVQLYFATTSNAGAWMIVPEATGTAARIRRIPGWGTVRDPAAEWRSAASGFEVRIRVPVTGRDATQFALDVIVNDAAPGRERRRGQLVMSGARGEFAYLRGDRHDPQRLVSFAVDDPDAVSRP